jgi:iron complex transport system substrate-binding protein
MYRTVLFVAALLVAAVAAPLGAASAGHGTVAATGEESTQECGFPVSYTDATGAEVTVNDEPQTVVTLGPGATQTMYEIGAEEKIVGATALSSYFPDYEDWTDVGVTENRRTRPSVEKIVAVDPDIVIAENIVQDDTVEQLRQAGITVYRFDRATNLEFVYDKVHRTGALVGAHEGAAEAVADMKYEVQIAREAARSGESPNALYVFFGFTTGSNTFIDSIITTAGGTNVAAEAGLSGYKEISDEVVADATVEWLLLNSDSPSVPDREAYQQTIAVQNDQTVVLNANNISQPAPRIVDPIRKLSRTWYPDAHEAARESVERPEVRPPCAPAPTTSAPSEGTTAAADGTTATAAGTTAADATGTATAADDGTTAAAEGDGGSPGFTVGIAAAAMLAALLALRRR